MVHVFLAEGFEEIEALTVVDILRRAGIEVCMVSVTGSREVTGAHGVCVKADVTFDEAPCLEESEMLLLPGGMPGALNLRNHSNLCALLLNHCEKGSPVAAICAAPFILGELGILEGKKATCYPGFEKQLGGAIHTADMVVKDGMIVTGKGPAAAADFSFAIVRMLKGESDVCMLKQGMLFD